MSRDGDGGCLREFGVALAGISCGILEEGTHPCELYIFFLFLETINSYVAFQAAEKAPSQHPREGLFFQFCIL